ADKPGRFRQPRFSPDGRTVYVLTDSGRDAPAVEAITVADKARKVVYATNSPVEAFAITDDGHRLAVALESNGLHNFPLLDLPSLRAQPLAAPPAGALSQGMTWDRPGERLWFGWRLSDDNADVWQMRLGRGTAMRLTRSPRPGLPRDAIARPTLIKAGDLHGWLWRPAEEEKPRVAALIAAGKVRPVFDKRIAALNFAGFAVVGADGPGAQGAVLHRGGLQSRPDRSELRPEHLHVVLGELRIAEHQLDRLALVVAEDGAPRSRCTLDQGCQHAPEGHGKRLYPHGPSGSKRPL